MRNEINIFLNNMKNILPYDLIKYIFHIIVHDKNIYIIQKQKKLKYILNKDIINFHNTYYYDNNYMIYRNPNNQFILKKISDNSLNTISLYSDNSSNIILNQSENSVVLFNSNKVNEYESEQKIIKLNIIYIQDYNTNECFLSNIKKIINGKTRILYKTSISNKLYIKHKGKMVRYTEYKDCVKSKM